MWAPSRLSTRGHSVQLHQHRFSLTTPLEKKISIQPLSDLLGIPTTSNTSHSINSQLHQRHPHSFNSRRIKNTLRPEQFHEGYNFGSGCDSYSPPAPLSPGIMDLGAPARSFPPPPACFLCRSTGVWSDHGIVSCPVLSSPTRGSNLCSDGQ
ncbi:hypothetical protein FRC08_017757 [Ceratobasidium sp. 394]|nr:hypothetical protein FRC08_017757 [Ceratobasidium sp. 394]